MTTLIRYITQRHFSMSHGFGKPLVRWLWLDALTYGASRWLTLRSRRFNAWCREVDAIFASRYDLGGSYTNDTGRDSWIDSYQLGNSPEEAVSEDVSYWED